MNTVSICTHLSKDSRRHPEPNSNFAFEWARDADPVIQPQSAALATVLGRAFYDGPNFKYILPDAEERFARLPALFRPQIRASQLYGRIDTAQGNDGAALWISPGQNLTLGRVVRAGFLSIPFQLGWASFKRCRNLEECLEDAHQRLVKKSHWYLMALGVEPSKQRRKIGEALMAPVLSRADSEGLPCYLETFNERALPFFKRQGFRMAGSGNIPGGGPDFWAMIRTPQTVAK